MTRNDIIRMAQEAGFPFNKYGLLQGDYDGEIDADEMFERFAALVSAAQREECAAAAQEFLTKGRSPLGPAVAAAIRARSQA